MVRVSSQLTLPFRLYAETSGCWLILATDLVPLVFLFVIPLLNDIHNLEFRSVEFLLYIMNMVDLKKPI